MWSEEELPVHPSPPPPPLLLIAVQHDSAAVAVPKRECCDSAHRQERGRRGREGGGSLFRSSVSHGDHECGMEERSRTRVITRVTTPGASRDRPIIIRGFAPLGDALSLVLDSLSREPVNREFEFRVLLSSRKGGQEQSRDCYAAPPVIRSICTYISPVPSVARTYGERRRRGGGERVGRLGGRTCVAVTQSR